jgi:hypothetical protein
MGGWLGGVDREMDARSFDFAQDDGDGGWLWPSDREINARSFDFAQDDRVWGWGLALASDREIERKILRLHSG